MEQQNNNGLSTSTTQDEQTAHNGQNSKLKQDGQSNNDQASVNGQIPLKTLISEISKAIESAQGTLQDAALENFLRYFNKNEQGDLNPITKDLHYSYLDSGTTRFNELQIPLVSLVPHGFMALDNLDMTLYANVTDVDDEIYVKLKSEEKKGLFCRKSSKDEQDEKRPGLCKLQLTYKNSEASEGLKSVLSTLAGTI